MIQENVRRPTCHSVTSTCRCRVDCWRSTLAQRQTVTDGRESRDDLEWRRRASCSRCSRDEEARCRNLRCRKCETTHSPTPTITWKINEQKSMFYPCNNDKNSNNKMLSCHTEAAQSFVSLNISLSHSRSLEVTPMSRPSVSTYQYSTATMYYVPFLRYRHLYSPRTVVASFKKLNKQQWQKCDTQSVQ